MRGGLLNRLGFNEARIGRFLVGFMIVGFTALIGAGIAAAWMTSRNEDHNRWVAHTYQVELAITDTRRLIEQMETARRGFLLTGDAAYLATFRRTQREFSPAFAHLRQLTVDNSAQQSTLQNLTALLAELDRVRQQSIDRIAAGDQPGAITNFARETSAGRMLRVRTLFNRMAATERTLLLERDRAQQNSLRAFYAILAVAGLLLLLTAVGAVLVVLRFTRDLQRSRDQLRDLADSLEDQVGERTADLSRANEEIQRFAYIVSHDLRAPLVNVMGFTAELDTAAATVRALIDRVEERAPELVDEDARLAAREDLPEAIGFIRTSTQKMDRLINAILTLSRQGRRVLTAETIDMAALVAAIRDTLFQQLEAREGEIVVEGTLPPLVTDRLAIEQIVSNLIENAVKYAQPGRPLRVTIRGARDRARVWYEIEDNGRGIDPKDHARVFDLFRRAGTQDQPGEGIGLAHVRALAYRLGGVIDVRSTLGAGATFRLSLPAHLQLTQGSE